MIMMSIPIRYASFCQGNLVSVGETNVVCVLIEKLRSVLGSDVALQLERAFVGLSLRRSHWFDSLPRPRQQCIMSQQVKVLSCPAGAQVRSLEKRLRRMKTQGFSAFRALKWLEIILKSYEI